MRKVCGKEGHVRSRSLGLGNGLEPISGLGYDLEIPLALDDHPHCLAEQRLLVCEQDAYSSPSLHRVEYSSLRVLPEAIRQPCSKHPTDYVLPLRRMHDGRTQSSVLP